jgi:hypothetical protein
MHAIFAMLNHYSISEFKIYWLPAETHPQGHELLYRSIFTANHTATKMKLGAMLALQSCKIAFAKQGRNNNGTAQN